MLLHQSDMAVRPLMEEDLPIIHQWFQDRDVFASIGGPYRVRSGTETTAYMQGWLTNSQNAVRLAILHREVGDPEGQLVGLISLTDIDWVHRVGVYQILVGDKQARGKGLGSRATDAILRHGFDDLGLNRIELELYADNEHAKALYRKFGFVEEGVKRQRCYRFGEYVDVSVMGLLAADFQRL